MRTVASTVASVVCCTTSPLSSTSNPQHHVSSCLREFTPAHYKSSSLYEEQCKMHPSVTGKPTDNTHEQNTYLWVVSCSNKEAAGGLTSRETLKAHLKCKGYNKMLICMFADGCCSCEQNFSHFCPDRNMSASWLDGMEVQHRCDTKYLMCENAP